MRGHNLKPVNTKLRTGDSRTALRLCITHKALVFNKHPHEDIDFPNYEIMNSSHGVLETGVRNSADLNVAFTIDQRI